MGAAPFCDSATPPEWRALAQVVAGQHGLGLADLYLTTPVYAAVNGGSGRDTRSAGARRRRARPVRR
jgi:hypothetical protein